MMLLRYLSGSYFCDRNHTLQMVAPLSMSLIIIVASFKFRHLEKLPKVVLSNDEPLAVLHAQQLLTIIFYSGPRLLVNHLQSPVCMSFIINILCFYFESV